jgi:gamma-tubulin complex component 5
MDSGQSWGDFHFLNTAFSDVVEATGLTGGRAWVPSTLVRLSYRSALKDKDKSISRTVRAIDGLSIEYAIPFPLTYIFTPESSRTYGEVFVFLMQIKRAKHVLAKVLVRSQSRDVPRSKNAELKVLYTLRSRLSWFIK